MNDNLKRKIRNIIIFLWGCITGIVIVILIEIYIIYIIGFFETTTILQPSIIFYSTIS